MLIKLLNGNHYRVIPCKKNNLNVGDEILGVNFIHPCVVSKHDLKIENTCVLNLFRNTLTIKVYPSDHEWYFSELYKVVEKIEAR